MAKREIVRAQPRDTCSVFVRFQTIITEAGTLNGPTKVYRPTKRHGDVSDGTEDRLVGCAKKNKGVLQPAIQGASWLFEPG